MIYYIPETVLAAVFSFVSERYSQAEEVPRYKEERGFPQFCGVLTQVRSDTYYPTLLDKAVYLLVGINKGHFFSNGNKRLALVVTTFFLGMNDLQLRKRDKIWYQSVLGELFPEYQSWEDFADFTPTDFATYNLSIMVADSSTHGVPHDELKRRAKAFFEVATEPYQGS
ncbi:Fic family protein [Patescibacteria group bacterium]|nr:Fic family protein [Patescibacteria group bacterium]